MAEDQKVDLTDTEKALWEKINPMINATVNAAVGNLSKQVTKSIGDLSTSFTTTFDSKLTAQLEELKTSLGGKPNGDGAGTGTGDDPGKADLLAKTKGLENEIVTLRKRTDQIETEKKALAEQKRQSDFRSAVTSLLNSAKVNSTDLAFNALQPFLKYTDDGKVLLLRDGEELSFTTETLKDWLDKDAPMFLPSTAIPGTGARNTGDGRNLTTNLTLDKVANYDKLSKEDQAKMRENLAKVAQQLST